MKQITCIGIGLGNPDTLTIAAKHAIGILRFAHWRLADAGLLFTCDLQYVCFL